MPSPRKRHHPETRKPPKRGRPSLGITKKVSLTLTESEWDIIEASGLHVAAFLKKKMKRSRAAKAAAPLTSTDAPQEAITYPRHYVEERWDIHLRELRIEGEELPPAEIIEAAKASMYGILYPPGTESAIVRTYRQYECPFTGKRYGSMDKLVRGAIPHLIQNKVNEQKQKAELDAIRERQNSPTYLMDLR